MTFLQLVNRLRAESGISGAQITSVTGQVGEYLQMVDYINMAYVDIQNTHYNWDFLRCGFRFSTVAGVRSYSPTTATGGVTFGEWNKEFMLRVHLQAQGASTQQFLPCIHFNDFKDTYLFGTQSAQTGKPAVATHKIGSLGVGDSVDCALLFYPIPDEVYVIDGEYFKTAQELSANGDIPLFPAKYHMTIVWRGLMYYATQMNAQELYVLANGEYRNLLMAMEQTLLPDIETCGALA